jgi:hypothetical protein
MCSARISLGRSASHLMTFPRRPCSDGHRRLAFGAATSPSPPGELSSRSPLLRRPCGAGSLRWSRTQQLAEERRVRWRAASALAEVSGRRRPPWPKVIVDATPAQRAAELVALGNAQRRVRGDGSCKPQCGCEIIKRVPARMLADLLYPSGRRQPGEAVANRTGRSSRPVADRGGGEGAALAKLSGSQPRVRRALPDAAVRCSDGRLPSSSAERPAVGQRPGPSRPPGSRWRARRARALPAPCRWSRVRGRRWWRSRRWLHQVATLRRR